MTVWGPIFEMYTHKYLQMANKNDMTYQFPLANEAKQRNLRYTCNAQNPSVVHQILPSVNLF